MESAIGLMNDFMQAFQNAGLRFGPSGVSTACVKGILVTFNPDDHATLARLEVALGRAGIHVYGQPDKKMKFNSFSILIGSKTPSSP